MIKFELMRLWFSGKTNPSQGLVEGSIPSSRSAVMLELAEVAQMVEQGFRKAKVGSPILPFGSGE